MWSRIKALPLRVKLIALIVFVALGGIYKSQERHSSSSYSSNASYSQPTDATSSQSSESASGGMASLRPPSSNSTSPDSSQVLARLQAQWQQMNNENTQCAAQMQQMNPWNYGTPPCEAKVQWNTAQMARVEAEIYRLQTGANVQPVDFVLLGSGSGSGSGAASSGDDGSNAVNRYSREGVLGQSKYSDSQGNEYQLANRPYYFRDRASGNIVGSDYAQAPDYQHDWEQLTYQPN